MTVFWFRIDLRLEDNTALFHALNENENVLPIFIFDKTILQHFEKNDARVTFIYNQLEKINNELAKNHKSLAVFYGKPLEIFEKLDAKEKSLRRSQLISILSVVLIAILSIFSYSLYKNNKIG